MKEKKRGSFAAKTSALMRGNTNSVQRLFKIVSLQNYTFLNLLIYVIRSTPMSQPNKVGLRCPSVRLYVRPSTKSFSDSDEIWYV